MECKEAILTGLSTGVGQAITATIIAGIIFFLKKILEHKKKIIRAILIFFIFVFSLILIALVITLAIKVASFLISTVYFFVFKWYALSLDLAKNMENPILKMTVRNSFILAIILFIAIVATFKFIKEENKQEKNKI